MSYKIIAVPSFKKELKKIAKKYPSIKTDFTQLAERLQEQPQQGTPLGKNCYKIRLPIASKGRGKSGGARVITHFYVSEKTVFLLSIYDKSEKESISDKKLQMLLASIEEGK